MMETETQISQRKTDPALQKSIETWARRRRLRYILVPVGILLLIVGLTLQHTVSGKVMAALGAVIVGMNCSTGSRCPVCGHEIRRWERHFGTLFFRCPDCGFSIHAGKEETN